MDATPRGPENNNDGLKEAEDGMKYPQKRIKREGEDSLEAERTKHLQKEECVKEENKDSAEAEKDLKFLLKRSEEVEKEAKEIQKRIEDGKLRLQRKGVLWLDSAEKALLLAPEEPGTFRTLGVDARFKDLHIQLYWWRSLNNKKKLLEDELNAVRVQDVMVLSLNERQVQQHMLAQGAY